MLNNKKFKEGLIKITVAICLAFTGPVLFVLGSNENGNQKLVIILSVCGGLIMLGCVYLGFIGIKTIISAIFDDTNE